MDVAATPAVAAMPSPRPVQRILFAARRSRLFAACTSLFAIAVNAPLAAEQTVADIRQGTNLAAALSPDGTTLVVELLDQLWTLPAAGGGATPLTPQGQRVAEPRYSPDGKQLVFQAWRDGQWDLYVLDIATGTQRALTATPHDERQPEFTADGRAVIYAANRTGHYCLWSLTLDNGVETQLTEEPGDAAFPAVSPLGLTAYVLARPGETLLRVLAPTGVATTVHSSSGRLFAPTWRPGGGVLVFGEQDAAQSSRLRMLLLTTPRVLKNASGIEDLFDTRPAWVSGAEMIYAADGQLWRRGLAYPVRRPVHLFAASTVEVSAAPADLPRFDARGPRTAAGIAGLTRSHDGRRSVFMALGDLWLLERGGQPTRLTDDRFTESDPTFWPDDESIVFTSERSGQFELWRLTLRDRRATQVTFGAMRPRRPAVRPDGKAIAFLEAEDAQPWPTEQLKLVEVRGSGIDRGEGAVLASGLRDAATPLWSDDGRSLALSASAFRAVNQNGPIVSIAPGIPTAEAAITEVQPQLTWEPAPHASEYVVQIGRLFDGNGSDYRRHVDLHVRDGRVAAIVSRGALPAKGPIVDARDATALPGFVDVHAHQAEISGQRVGRMWLAYGVTTVRELATDTNEAIARAETWASGRVPGPHLVVTPVQPAHRPFGVSAPVRDYAGIANGFAHSLFEQARDTGAPRLGGAAEYGAVPRRPYELHVSPSFTAYQDGFGRLIASATVLPPGLGALSGLGAWPDSMGSPRDAAFKALFTPFEQSYWPQPRPTLAVVPALQQTVARLVRAGGRVAIGSEAPATPYGLGVHLELALLVSSGIANDQVLRMATLDGALALGLEQQVGTLEEGKLADFVVVDGDPLVRIADTLKVVAVAKEGVWFDRATLLAAP